MARTKNPNTPVAVLEKRRKYQREYRKRKLAEAKKNDTAATQEIRKNPNIDYLRGYRDGLKFASDMLNE